MNDALLAQLAGGATPLSLDPDAPSDDLQPLADRARGAEVVALGSAVRHFRELLALSHRVMRLLIDRHGFRALSLEGDEAASSELDAYVLMGEGDPRAILARARPFWRFEEILGAVRWIRGRNEREPGDPVRVVLAPGPPRDASRQLAAGEDIERRLADTIIAWRERTGQRIVHWGGLAHSAKGPSAGGSAGARLQSRFGAGYVSVGLTFSQALMEPAAGDPPADSVEALLGAVGRDAFLLDIRRGWPGPVEEWLDSPAKVRQIGPGIHELRAPSLRAWLDFIIHARCATPAEAV